MTPGAVPLAAATHVLATRDENLEGIPVFLALEDLGVARRAVPARRDAPARALSRLAVHYLREQLAGRDAATLDDVALVLAVLAAHHFDTAGEGS